MSSSTLKKVLDNVFILKEIAKKKSPGIEVIIPTLALRIGNDNHIFQLNVELLIMPTSK